MEPEPRTRYSVVIVLPFGLILATLPGLLLGLLVVVMSNRFTSRIDPITGTAVQTVEMFVGWLASSVIILLGTTTIRQLSFRAALLSFALACVLFSMSWVTEGRDTVAAALLTFVAIGCTCVAFVTRPRRPPAEP
jgi:dolichyl-phosphate-mannose--protein O-mannosyl transferase